MTFSPRSFLALFRALVLSHLREEKTRSALALLGVGLGVSVVVAIAQANAATLASFSRTVDNLAGKAQLRVRGNGVPLGDELLAKVLAFPGAESAVPVLRFDAAVADGSGETLSVLGLDLLGDGAFRDYAPRVETDSFAGIVSDPRAVVLTRAFAERHGLKLGDPLALAWNGREISLKVAALLRPSEDGPAIDSATAVMEIAGARESFGTPGRLDFIDALLAPGVDVDEARQGLEEWLPGNVLVERPERRGESVEKMLAAFQLNLEALSHIALLVGVFLIYNTVSVSVIRRRAEIGTLRAIGARRSMILLAFMAEGLLFGVPGALLGCAFGYALAGFLVESMSHAVSYHWAAMEASSAGGFDWVAGARGAGAGVVFSLIASAIPASEAGRVAPANTTREGSLETARRSRDWWLAPLGLGLLGLAWLLARQPPVNGLPLFGLAAGLAAVFGFAALAPALISLIIKALAPLCEKAFGAEGLLASSALEGSRGRATVAVTGLMIGLAMVVAMGAMTGSFRLTVIRWLEQTLVSDLYVNAADKPGPGAPPVIPMELEERLARLPSVADTNVIRTRRIEYNGYPTNFSAWRVDKALGNARVEFLGGNTQEKLRLVVEEGQAMVTETFAYRHGVEAGDALTLPVEGGTRDFRVAGVYPEYSSDLGFVVIHWPLFRELFPSEKHVDAVALTLREGAVPDEARSELYAALADEDWPRLSVATTGEIRRNALDIFDQTFAVTNALLLIAMIVAVLGVTNTLLAMILDRREELLTLRCLGMSRARLARVVMIESGLLGAAGTLLGVACGSALSLILIYVVNKQSFGWTIQFAPPLGTLALSVAALYLVTLLAGLVPARQAARADWKRR